MSLGIFQNKPKPLPPHPALPFAFILVVEDAVKVAWTRIRDLPLAEFDLASAHEDTITQKLHEVLLDDIFDSDDVDGFNGDLISKITREEKLRGFDGSQLDPMPDLVFGIRHSGRRVFRRTQDGLFVECKPIDGNHTVGAHYCNKGIIRFVEGKYAWCMLSAMMVGYSAPGYEIVPKLTDALSKSTTIGTKQTPSVCPQSKPVLFAQETYVTVHERNFSFVETGEPAPDIKLRHVWLNRE